MKRTYIIPFFLLPLALLTFLFGCSSDAYATYHHFDYDDVPPATMEGGEYTLRTDESRQTILGLGFEIQSDDFGVTYENNDRITGVPYDLIPSERTRLGKEMLSGFRYMRMAMGLWFRGMTDDRKNLVERYPGQVSTLLQLIEDAGVEGISMEYWSPAPYWKSNDHFVNGTLKQYDEAFLKEFSDALVRDLQYMKDQGFKVCTWGLQNEPRYEEVEGYSHCHYKPENYVKTFRAVAPKIRAADPKIEIIVDTNDGNVGDYAKELKKTENEDLLQYVDAWVYHRIGDDSNYVMDRCDNYLEGSLGKPIYQNEYEYFFEQVESTTEQWRMVNTAQSIMNWMTFVGSQKWYWLHALKPASESGNKGFSFGFYRQPFDTADRGLPDLKPGYFTYNWSNYNGVAGFLKHMPWDSVRYQVDEANKQHNYRIMAWKKPDGKFVIALTNRSDEWYEYRIALDKERTFAGYRYDRDNLNKELSVQNNRSELTVPVKPWSIEFWVEQ